MNYLPRSRNRTEYKKKLGFLAGLFIVGALLFSLFDSFIISAISPLWRAENAFSRSLGKTLDYFHTQNSLVRDNESLKERITSLELSLMAESPLTTTFKAEGGEIRGAVLTHPPQSPYDVLIVDVGSRDGVVLGALAGLPEGPELGVVSEVFRSNSKIKLFSAPGEKTNAVLERHQVVVVLEGAGAGNFKLSLPRETEVVVGDRILSPSRAGALMAVVEEVNLSPTDPFKEVLARSPANIFSIRFITILP